MTATINPFRAPTSCETSHLAATHVSCDACDDVARWDGTRAASEWTCTWCGDDEEQGPAPVWEHHSDKPLGFRDDAKCHWPAVTVGGLWAREVWVYKAAVPG